jgi:hypothetical protein
MKKGIECCTKAKGLFKATIDESQQRLEGGKYSVIGDETSAHPSSETRSCVPQVAKAVLTEN